MDRSVCNLKHLKYKLSFQNMTHLIEKKFEGSDVAVCGWYFLTDFPRLRRRRRDSQLCQVKQRESGSGRKSHNCLVLV